MELNVWTQLFVQAVNFLSSRLSSLTAAKKPTSPIFSSNVHANDASSSSTSKVSLTDGAGVLKVMRNPKLATTDALFGDMVYEGQQIGFTMERKEMAIPEGTYRGYKRDSAHFGTRVVGIDVPNRTDIECHPANIPSQVKGCVAIGSTIDGDALDNSRAAFDIMMLILPETFTVVVSSQA